MSRDTLVFFLQNLGFEIDTKKSVFKPDRQLEFLGMLIDTKSIGLLSLTVQAVLFCKDTYRHLQEIRIAARGKQNMNLKRP